MSILGVGKDWDLLDTGPGPTEEELKTVLILAEQLGRATADYIDMKLAGVAQLEEHWISNP